ncbi:MAG: dTMP kinase [Pseudomonadota bacterium]
MKRGLFITLEGGEGTGKSTQIKKLHAALQEKGIDCIVTREPGGTAEAEKIRNLLVQRDGGNWDPLSEALLLFAARREHLVNCIWPALEKGQWVISDRFVDSSRVYQGYGLGVHASIIEGLYYMVAEGFEPDLTFVFDIPPEIGLQRSSRQLDMTIDESESTEDRYERIGLEFHQRLREGYLKIAETDPERCVILDAVQDIEAIHNQMVEIISHKFLKEVRGCCNGTV